MRIPTVLIAVFSLLLVSAVTFAQQAVIVTSTPAPAVVPDPLPARWTVQYSGYEPQGWNNCGPATLTNALKLFGYDSNQSRAEAWLKPNYEDKNVSPWQMVEYVNTQIPELDVYAIKRYGGTQDLLKRLLVADLPVIVELGYDPEPERLGWMGHYLLVKGYDDNQGVFITSDSYLGDGTTYTYDHVQEFWEHFNFVYIVLYPAARKDEVMGILGDNADEQTNVLNALTTARTQATVNTADAFAWFNMGTNFTMLKMYTEAAISYDEARKYGLPFRMLWYQFGPFDAYYNTGRYDDMIALAQQNLNDGGGQYVEETFYYGGLARLGKGDTERAQSNFAAALQFNPNFTPAREAEAQIGG